MQRRQEGASLTAGGARLSAPERKEAYAAPPRVSVTAEPDFVQWVGELVQAYPSDASDALFMEEMLPPALLSALSSDTCVQSVEPNELGFVGAAVAAPPNRGSGVGMPDTGVVAVLPELRGASGLAVASLSTTPLPPAAFTSTPAPAPASASASVRAPHHEPSVLAGSRGGAKRQRVEQGHDAAAAARPRKVPRRTARHSHASSASSTPAPAVPAATPAAAAAAPTAAAPTAAAPTAAASGAARRSTPQPTTQPSGSVVSERRRRARCDNLLQTLKQLVVPPDPSVKPAAPKPGKRKRGRPRTRPIRQKRVTKERILTAAIDLIKQLRAVTRHSLVRPPPSCLLPSLGGADREDGAGGRNLERFGQPQVARSLFAGYVRVFEQPDKRELVRMIHHVCMPKPTAHQSAAASTGVATVVASSASTTTLATDTDAIINLVSTVYRMCMPTVIDVVAAHGFYGRITDEELNRFFDFARMQWDHAEVRALWGQLQGMWLVPYHKGGFVIDMVAPAAMRDTLQLLWNKLSSAETLSEIADRAARAQADVTRVWEAITPILIPLWLSAAQRLGFPRSLEGIARLHMAAYAQDDAELVELSYRTLSAVPDAVRRQLMPTSTPTPSSAEAALDTVHSSRRGSV